MNTLLEVQHPAVQPELWQAPKAAEFLGVDLGWIYRACRQGLLPHIRIGAGPRPRIRFRPADMERFLTAHTHGGMEVRP